MSTRKTLIRYNKILKSLKASPKTFEELKDILERQSEDYGDDLSVSKRTFQRDMNDILSIFKIEIDFNHHIKKYEIKTEDLEVSNRMLEAFNLFEVLSSTEKVQEYIYFDSYIETGEQYLQKIVQAIQQKKVLNFTYQKYWITDVSNRQLESYAIRLFKKRWYLIGKDLKDKQIKTFGIDRMSDLAIVNQKYTIPKDFSVQKMFENSFGIISKERPNDTVEKVILQLEPTQGKYIKSLPLHPSQKVIADQPDYLLISLELYITFDFVKEILSMGNLVKIIQPQSLIKQVKSNLQQALEQY